MAQRFRKKPVDILAVRWNGQNIGEILEFVDGKTRLDFSSNAARGELIIETINGDVTVPTGEWIVRGVEGEFYPCRADIFAETYEPADPPVTIEIQGIPKGPVIAEFQK